MSYASLPIRRGRRAEAPNVAMRPMHVISAHASEPFSFNLGAPRSSVLLILKYGFDAGRDGFAKSLIWCSIHVPTERAARHQLFAMQTSPLSRVFLDICRRSVWDDGLLKLPSYWREIPTLRASLA